MVSQIQEPIKLLASKKKKKCKNCTCFFQTNEQYRSKEERHIKFYYSYSYTSMLIYLIIVVGILLFPTMQICSNWMSVRSLGASFFFSCLYVERNFIYFFSVKQNLVNSLLEAFSSRLHIAFISFCMLPVQKSMDICSKMILVKSIKNKNAIHYLGYSHSPSMV